MSTKRKVCTQILTEQTELKFHEFFVLSYVAGVSLLSNDEHTSNHFFSPKENNLYFSRCLLRSSQMLNMIMH